jgi:hypothetical protein
MPMWYYTNINWRRSGVGQAVPDIALNSRRAQTDLLTEVIMMLCPSCHGRHWVVHCGRMVPCPECGGIGEVHCCDGLAAQRDCPTTVFRPTGYAPSEDVISLPHSFQH